MSEKCPNCGFVANLSPRERRILTAEIEQLRKVLGDLFAAWVDDADLDECGSLIARVQPLLSAKSHD